MSALLLLATSFGTRPGHFLPSRMRSSVEAAGPWSRLHAADSAARNETRASCPHLKVVLGFSGGKDSIVSLFTLIESGYEVIPVLLNEGDRTWQDLRKWFPKLRRLGLDPMVSYLGSMRRGELHQRYGDHHYSSYQIGWLTALLAICAVRSGAATICLGIERSADETDQRYRDRWVNHQHQKTTKHLRRLERFYRRVLHDGLRLASPIAE